MLAAPEDVLNDPDRLAPFDAAAARIGPDPVVYGQWFDRADERRRLLVVGARRYSTVRDSLGSAPSWEHFIDHESGQLLSLRDLKAESAVARAERVAKVRAQIAERERLLRQTAAYGFL